MDVSYESVDKKQRTKERTKTEDERERAFRTRVLTENELHMHRAHAKQGTVSEQELSQVWRGGVTERRDGKYCRRKRGPYSEMLSGKKKWVIFSCKQVTHSSGSLCFERAESESLSLASK